MPLLELRNIVKTFREAGSTSFKAVDDVNFHVEAGECVAVVGESGSGKSTLARIALGLTDPDSGDVLVEGRSRASMTRANLHLCKLRIQPIFQDPAGSFNPRRTIGGSLLQAIRQVLPASEGRTRALELLSQVGIRPPEDYFGRFPHELSGGQRQRVAIARALGAEPELIIADEPLSGADVSIRAQILNLLMELRERRKLAYMLITHDMLVASAVSQRIVVMHRGRIVEHGETSAIIGSPQHPYTVRLLRAVQSIDAPSLITM